MIMEIYRKIDKNLIQFDFVIDNEKENFYVPEIENMGGKVYILKKYCFFNHFLFTKSWNDFFKKHSEYKIIHCHVRSVASIVLKIAKKFKIKTICHSHSTSNGKGIKSVLKKILQKRIPKYTDCFMACSNESARWLYGKKICESNNCLILNNAIDSKKYLFNKNKRNEIRRKIEVDDDTILIGQIGRIEYVKNHKFTINIFKEIIKKKNQKYKLIIIGDGSLKNEIYKLCNDYNILNDVIFTGNVSNVNEYLQAIDLMLLPSYYEGLSLCLVEAQAASLNCILSSNVRDGIIIKELINQISIFDIKNWVEYILNFKKNSAMRINRYKEIKESGFDIDDNVKKIEKMYFALLKESDKNVYY